MIDRKRLSQLLGMTASAHDGEALNAIKLANKMLKSAALSWPDILEGQYDQAFVKKVANDAYQAGKADSAPKAPRKTFAGYAKYLLGHCPDELSAWETEFLESWKDRHYPPSDKQLAVFVRLAERLNVPIPPATIGFQDVE